MVRSPILPVIAFCIASCLLTTGCKDNGADPDSLEANLRGQVLDEQGRPVEGVGVHYLFDLLSSQLSKRDHTPPSTTIRYELPHPGHVTLKVLRWYSRELIATLIDTQQNAGVYQVTFDASRFTNGVYLYRLSIDTTVTEKRMLLLNTVISELVQTRPLVKSDVRGQVTIAIAQFGLGVPFIRTSSSGNILDSVYISPTIRMVLYKEGYQTLVQPVSIDPARELRVNFVLRR